MRKFGLIGKHLGHSFSKNFFKHYFEEYQIDATYENFEMEDISQVSNLLDQGVEGFNVTIPFKESILPILDQVSDEAAEIGAVNCVKIENGRLIGYNTDAFGFQQMIKPFLTNKHERAVVFGTGGASKAVAYVLMQIGIDVIYVSRNPEGAKQFRYEDVNEYMLNACKLLVNTTPVGMYPNVEESLPIPYEWLTEDHLVVDLIYNPEKTEFLRKSEAEGATILNGETMLKQQALKSWDIWR